MFLCTELSRILATNWILTTGRPLRPQSWEWNELPHEEVSASFKAFHQTQEDTRFQAKHTAWPCRGYFITSLCLNFITYKMESIAVHLHKAVRGLKEKIYTKDSECLPVPTKCSINGYYSHCFSLICPGWWRLSLRVQITQVYDAYVGRKWTPCHQVRGADSSQVPISYRETRGFVGE